MQCYETIRIIEENQYINRYETLFPQECVGNTVNRAQISRDEQHPFRPKHSARVST